MGHPRALPTPVLRRTKLIKRVRAEGIGEPVLTGVSVQRSHQMGEVSMGPWFCAGKVGFSIIHCSIFLPASPSSGPERSFLKGRKKLPCCGQPVLLSIVGRRREGTKGRPVPCPRGDPRNVEEIPRDEPKPGCE